MRHRTYKVEHFRASLRPTMAAALAWLADLKPKQVVVDPDVRILQLRRKQAVATL